MNVLLSFCEILDTFVCTCLVGVEPDIDPLALTNIKCVRTWDSYRTVRFAWHITTPSIPVRTRCGCLLWQDASRTVYTIYDANSALGWMTDMGDHAPEQFGSLAVIYKLRADLETSEIRCRERVEAHSTAFHQIIKNAWLKGKVTTVVNAASLDALRGNLSILDRRPNGPHALGESAESILRRRATRAVMEGDIPPGPVSPVHFVTLEEYRAHVGEWEFALDTQKGWIPQDLEARSS